MKLTYNELDLLIKACEARMCEIERQLCEHQLSGVRKELRLEIGLLLVLSDKLEEERNKG